MEAQGGLIKLIAKNHQYLGVNNAVEALQGKGHRIWGSSVYSGIRKVQERVSR